MRKAKKEKPKYSRKNFIVCGNPIFIATDNRGKYRVDLPEGYWFVLINEAVLYGSFLKEEMFLKVLVQKKCII